MYGGWIFCVVTIFLLIVAWTPVGMLNYALSALPTCLFRGNGTGHLLDKSVDFKLSFRAPSMRFTERLWLVLPLFALSVPSPFSLTVGILKNAIYVQVVSDLKTFLDLLRWTNMKITATIWTVAIARWLFCEWPRFCLSVCHQPKVP